MAFIPILTALILSQLASPTGVDAVKRLQAHLSVTPVNPINPAALAGHYTEQSSELKKRVGGFLSGEDLYLFPAGSYIYSELADIMPETIYDKGRWSVVNSVLQLSSDSDIHWDPNVDRTHVSIRRTGRPNEIMLVGLSRAISYFEENAGDDPEFMLLLVGMLRVRTFDAVSARATKARLLKGAWRPEFFRQSPPSNTRLHPSAAVWDRAGLKHSLGRRG
jgi:hypothetical protein